MKELIISSKQLKKEGLYFGSVFLIAFLLNVISILKFNTEWSELYSQLGYVVMLAIVLYLLILVIRVVIKAIKLLF